jgi:putative ABC transport system permease protein
VFDRDHWQEIYSALSGNKLRTFLTAFGVFWGVFMLVIMLGSGTGLQNGVFQDFADTATNSFFVWTRSTTRPYQGLPVGRRMRLTNEDTEILRKQVPDAAVVAPRIQLRGYGTGNNVSRGKQAGAFTVMGDSPVIRDISVVRMTEGRFLNPLDIVERRKVAVIGSRVVEVLFEDGTDPIGEYIRINGVFFKVVGTFRPDGADEDGNDDAQTIHLPFSTFQQAFNYGNQVGWYAIRSTDGVRASLVEEQVLSLLKKRKRVHPEDQRAFGHFNLEEEFDQIAGLFASIRALIWIVGIGTLAAGVIGVSNIMLVIVRERTNEIGIRRAVGATPWSVMRQVVLESLILTGVAGYCGLMVGMALVELANFLMSGQDTGMFRNPEVSLAVVGKALLILVGSGILAGMIPARRAIKIRPVEALRAV